jgi:hypothetical protein
MLPLNHIMFEKAERDRGALISFLNNWPWLTSMQERKVFDRSKPCRKKKEAGPAQLMGI